MKTQLNRIFAALTLLALSILNSQLSTAFAQGTAFTYQGQLENNGSPANGLYDVRFTVWDAPANGNLIAGPLTNSATGVTNGLFAVTLDFGAGVFTGPARWLELDVRTNGGGSFTPLMPLEPVMPVPYAIMANSASNLLGTLPAAQLSGTLPATQLPTSVLTNNASGVVLNGTFIGNGAGVTNVNLQSINSGGAIGWVTNVSHMTNYIYTTNSTGFSTAETVPGTGSPYSLVALNVNGNGKLGLVYSDVANKQLTLLTNNGSGSFGYNSFYPVPGEPYSIATADFNGDGKPDLISVDYQDSALTIFTNTGSGGFAVWQTVPDYYYARAVTPIDVNGTGNIGFACANYYYEPLSVFVNNGNGSFTRTDYSIGNGLIGITTADVNGDGKPDLICCDLLANTMIVLTNNGTGGFVVSATLPAGSETLWVTAADINGDGKVDLISANAGINILTVYTNNGTGGFALASSPTVGGLNASVVVTDVNGDGKPDLICSDSSTNTLTILTNAGGGNFGFYATVTVGAGPVGLVATNIDGDSQLFLISANGTSNTISVLTNILGETTNIVTTSVTNAALPSFSGVFAGNGAGLTNLNVAQLPGAVVTNTETGVTLGGTFTGNGSGLTNLNVAQLPGTVLTNNQNGVTLNGTFSGNGGGLTNLNVAGTLPWQTVTSASQQAQSNTGYLVTNASQVTISLPAMPNVGDIVSVSGVGAGGWQIIQGYTNQYLFTGSEINITLNSGAYNITVCGAQGGSGYEYGGGLGAEMEAQFNFATSTNLTLMVGGSGGSGDGGGGGGGSFVVNGNTPLIIAGGGGGGGGYYGNGGSGNTGTNGSNGNSSGFGYAGSGGTVGNGGGGSETYAGGGGGFYSSGINGLYGSGGSSFFTGYAGGYFGNGAFGGYGGGGNGGQFTGGGGGGYSGGGCGDYYAGGGGGGSFIASSATTVTNLAGIQSGNGEINIAQVYYTGGQGSAIELQYVGNGQWQPVSLAGTITTGANTLGAVSLAQLPGTVVTNNETGVNLSGTFTGNGNGFTNLNASAIIGGANTNILFGSHTLYITNGIIMNVQ